jgi:hypothetical protein
VLVGDWPWCGVHAARFSEAFLVLRAQQSGVPLAFIPLVMVVMNVLYSSRPIPLANFLMA